MKVKDILDVKGSRVVNCHEDNSVMDALAIFAANRIGSLLVVDAHENILGILAPRDVLIVVLKDYENVKNIKVSTVMTKDLLVATLDDDIEYIQNIMTENRVRHIPILDGGSVKGMISIGDVVKAQMKEKDVENRYLKDYIEGKYPA
jgi:CBS domain-containing protein